MTSYLFGPEYPNGLNLLPAFKPGAVVRYIGARSQHKNRLATVKRIVKSRQVVTIEWNDGDRAYYDAYPHSLELAS